MIFRKTLSVLAAALFMAVPAFAQQSSRSETILKDWKFRHDHSYWSFQDWENVTVPHDWAIYGPFDRANDLQTVAVTQNGETTATVKTGRTGGLPYVGKGTYKRTLDVAPGTLDGRRHILLFDGAMSEAQVFAGNTKVCFWPYGYNSFWCDITEHLSEGTNDISVLLENRPQSSRWYPGAGLFRKVRYITLPKVHVPVWGTYVTTPYVSEEYASVTVRTRIEGLEDGTPVTVKTSIKDADGNVIVRRADTRKIFKGEVQQQITINGPQLWSPEDPALYYADTEIYTGASVDTDWSGKRPAISISDGHILADKVSTRFGIRSIEIRPDKGFFLNGKMRKFQGVCMHHDLGPLGAAVNKAALKRQLTILKDMGCDAIRTSHNMPAEELIELCDEMGFMVMLENFDEWDAAKCENGYHRFFNEDSGDGVIWAEKDMINMLHHFRNNASVVMWSIGNEVPSQWAEGGLEVAAWLQSLCHREDPTRPVTCGMDQFDAVLGNGFAGQLDVAGFNYKVDRYPQAYSLLPQAIILGSETASTVSSRGVYHFPVTIGNDILHPDNQSSSYDTEHCFWSNIPDNDFAADEDYPWCIGQFVWTGFDYLGEPSPYDTDAWPNHSSVFGIVDLAYIPKDRFYLYRSLWNEDEPTLHVLPHWNWAGREGQVTPVYAYTSYPSAELFVNGVSQGRRFKAEPSGETPELGRRAMERYRLMWDDVVYQPGSIKVVAYDNKGVPAMEKTIRTAGKAVAVKLVPDRTLLTADGEDICFVNVSLVDEMGNPVPVDNRLMKVKVKGAGSFRAIGNGDPTCLEPFHLPEMHLFSGQLTVLVQSSEEPGEISVEVSGKGVKKAVLTIRSEASAPNEYVRRASRLMDSVYPGYTAGKTIRLKDNLGTLSATAAIAAVDEDYKEVLDTKVTPVLDKYMYIKRSPAAYAQYAGASDVGDRLYEDNMRLAIDCVDIYMKTRDTRYLQKAETVWKFVREGISMTGGVYASELARKKTDPVMNAYAVILGAKLYQATDYQDYLDMAKGMYIWAQENPSDALSLAGNSGLMIQAGALLFRITSRLPYLEDARSKAAFCHETFFKPAEDTDGKQFRNMDENLDPWQKALMVRGLIDLYNTDGEPVYVNDIRKSMEKVWSETGSGFRIHDRSNQTSLAEIYARLGAL